MHAKIRLQILQSWSSHTLRVHLRRSNWLLPHREHLSSSSCTFAARRTLAAFLQYQHLSVQQRFLW
jgi:hypothetical protein